MNVTKRDGTTEPLDMEKLHKVVMWACKGLEDVYPSQIEMKSHIQFADNMKTSDIHQTVVKSAADLISEASPDYQYAAARLAIFNLRKLVFGKFTPPDLYTHVSNLTSQGLYDNEILSEYSEHEFGLLNSYIDHTRDMKFSYAAVKQLIGKYLVQNRVTGKIYKSPQFMYMLIPMALFAKYPAETRLQYIKDFYDASSMFKLSLPTPIMSGVRTPTRQFSSCVLIDSDDSLDSINATASSIVKYISQRGGVGINIGRLRGIGSEIRGGEAYHTGVIPFIKHFQTAVKSCSQGGVRGGAATVFYPLWHAEAESLLVLKNNRGTEENRIRHLDYGVQFNKLLYQRMIEGKNITLFSPSDVPGLYEAFFADQDEFERLYTKYEADETIKKTSINALELFTAVANERAQTGRIYIQNVDHTNTHSPFKDSVYQSNLCLEIALPTTPLKEANDPDGEIALCTLSAFNLGEVELTELPHLSNLIVRALDSLLDYQHYAIPAAEKAKYRRTLGVGITNLAYYLAKNGVKYSDGSANNLMHRTMEAIQYNLLTASNNLAMEQGPCEYFDKTTYSEGVLPIDTYKKEIDDVHSQELLCDWELLRSNISFYGLRNSTLTALMPCETSSQITNSTNGIEPPRGFVSVKASKDGILKQVVPRFKELRNNYELLWSIPNNKGYLQLVGIMQKFVDQAISANTNYDPSKFPDEKVSLKTILQDLTYAHKLGLKTIYYHNTRDLSQDTSVEVEDDSCSGGACKL